LTAGQKQNINNTRPGFQAIAWLFDLPDKIVNLRLGRVQVLLVRLSAFG
jgi:hypothetical protein